MPSPLPGMNPFIEQPELWSEFHSLMIVAMADSLDDLLSREYRVAVKKRLYLSQDDEQVLIGIFGVSVTAELPSKTGAAVAVSSDQSTSPTAPPGPYTPPSSPSAHSTRVQY